MAGKTKTQMEEESRKNGIKYDYRVFAIDMPREILYDRINRRVDIMLDQGLIQEVKELYEKYSLTEREISVVENTIRAMDTTGGK